MTYNFREYNQDQMFLIAPSLNDWLPEDHLARYVDETVEIMDLKTFYEKYNKEGDGNSAYHPKMLVKLLLYSYCIGVTSSRKIAQACEDQVAFRYLTVNQYPDFRTIARFRRNNKKELTGLFISILVLCKKSGLVKMGTVALDGTKLKANAALESNRTIEGIEKEVTRLMAEAEETDTLEDKKYGADRRGDEVPDELKGSKARLKKLQSAKEKLEQEKTEQQQKHEEKLEQRRQEEDKHGKKRGRKPAEEPKDKEPKVNLTDPDSKIMKTRKGYEQGYNGQAVVDCETQIIVAQDLTQDCNDKRQLEPMLEKIEEQAKQTADELLADAGYCSETNLELENEATELFIAVAKEWKTKKAQRETGYPSGAIPKNSTKTALMERKLLTKEGRGKYKLRSQTVEPVFGQMKFCRGLTTLRLRGKDGASLEWSLYCSTHNLLKLWRAAMKNSSKN